MMSIYMCVAVVGDVIATLYLDNQLVGQTGWKPCSQSCWDQRLTLELERVTTTSVLLAPSELVISNVSKIM